MLNLIPIIGQIVAFISQVAIALLVNYLYLIIAEAEETVALEKLVDMGKGIIAKVQPEMVMFFVWALVVSIVTGIGFIACCVGVFATIAIAMIATAKSYVDVIKDDSVVDVVAEEVSVEE